MVRRIITIIVAALAAIALCALAAPHAHAATVGDVPPATDDTETTDDGWVDTPQSGRGPSMDEQPAPGGRTRLRDVLRPCVTEADTYDGCYDASRDSGLWRSEGGEYRTWGDGTWTWTPARPASDGPDSPADGASDADSPAGAVDAPEPVYGAPEDAPDVATEESTDDGDVLPSVAADSPEVLADADDQYAAADDDVMPGDGQYAADGTRVALAHTGPSTTMAATLAMGATAALMAGAALMALARADR